MAFVKWLLTCELDHLGHILWTVIADVWLQNLRATSLTSALCATCTLSMWTDAKRIEIHKVVLVRCFCIFWAFMPGIAI